MEILFLFLFLFLFLLLPIFSLIFLVYHHPKQAPKHGFKNYPLLVTLPEFLSNRHRFLEWFTDILSRHPTATATAVFHRPGGVHGVITAEPAAVEHILKTSFPNYPKAPRFISLLHDFLGSGIFNSDDHLWRLQRKTASFEFSSRSLKTFALDSIRLELATRLLPLLRQASGSGLVLDLQDVLERFSFDSVCKLAFYLDPGCLAGDGSGESEFMRAFEVAATLSSGRFMYALPFMWKVKKVLDVGSEKRLRESIRTVHEFVDNIIRLRLQQGKNDQQHHEDLLSRFINSSSDTTDDRESCSFLRDVVISFILAGRDSTSSGLTWFFWLLSRNPDVVGKIRSEVSLIRTRAGKEIGDTYGFEELREMNYLHGAISEALRLYPPVPFDARTCACDDVLPDGTEVKRDWLVTYHTYAMGRMERIWGSDWADFRPERWLDENGLYQSDSPFRFPVFHAGPRICLGKEMAYIQMKSIAACVVEGFEFDVMLDKDTRPGFVLSLTLRMKGGLPVKVKATNI